MSISKNAGFAIILWVRSPNKTPGKLIWIKNFSENNVSAASKRGWGKLQEQRVDRSMVYFLRSHHNTPPNLPENTLLAIRYQDSPIWRLRCMYYFDRLYNQGECDNCFHSQQRSGWEICIYPRHSSKYFSDIWFDNSQTWLFYRLASADIDVNQGQVVSEKEFST